MGHEAAKFTPAGIAAARALITQLLSDLDAVCVSGACHLGGIDIWAAEIARDLGRKLIEYPPETLHWENGFRERNIRIAERSDIVHCIVVNQLPESFAGRRFEYCYHCHTSDHVKSGGCWTRKYCEHTLGKRGQTHIINQKEER